MSFKEELRTALENQGVRYVDLKVNKDDNYRGRSATSASFVIRGDNGPVFFNTSFTHDLKLSDVEHAELVATNAARAYANHFWHDKEVEE